jgi:CBS domain-containing protein
MTVRLRPPLGFFKTFVVEKSGEHKDELNLKFKCIAPLIDVVRLFSLEKGVTEVSTVDRLHALKGRHSVVNEMGDDIEHAFEFISLLRIHHQYHQIEAGTEPDNFVNPDELSNLEKRSLRESCQIISRAQDAIAKQYSPGMRI